MQSVWRRGFRIWNGDGTRSVRFGAHEVPGSAKKYHFHLETWYSAAAGMLGGDDAASVFQAVYRWVGQLPGERIQKVPNFRIVALDGEHGPRLVHESVRVVTRATQPEQGELLEQVRNSRGHDCSGRGLIAGLAPVAYVNYGKSVKVQEYPNQS